MNTDYIYILPEEKVEELVNLITHFNHIIFPIMTRDKELAVIVYFNDIRETIFSDSKSSYSSVSDLIIQPNQVVNQTDTMETVMDKFEKTRKVFLPVLKNDKY